jgi:hypothetical protein
MMSESDFDFFGYYAPPSPSSPLTDEDLSIGQFLEPLPNSFEPHWSTDAESIGSSSTSNNDSSLGRLNVPEPELQRSKSTTPPSLDDSTVWVDDLIGSSSFGQIPVKDTISANVQKNMQRTEKVPNVNIFPPEDDDFECVLLLTCCIAN